MSCQTTQERSGQTCPSARNEQYCLALLKVKSLFRPEPRLSGMTSTLFQDMFSDVSCVHPPMLNGSEVKRFTETSSV